MPSSLTFRELGIIKRIAGVRGGEINDALEAGDAEVIAAFAIIAMRRAGQDVNEGFVLDMDVQSVMTVPDPPAAEEANPPE